MSLNLMTNILFHDFVLIFVGHLYVQDMREQSGTVQQNHAPEVSNVRRVCQAGRR